MLLFVTAEMRNAIHGDDYDRIMQNRKVLQEFFDKYILISPPSNTHFQMTENVPELLTFIVTALGIPKDRHMRCIDAMLAVAREISEPGKGIASATPLARLQATYHIRYDNYKPPANGIETEAQRREARNLVSTFNALVRQQKKEGKAMDGRNAKVREADRQLGVDRRKREREAHPPRPTGRPRKDAAKAHP